LKHNGEWNRLRAREQHDTTKKARDAHAAQQATQEKSGKYQKMRDIPGCGCTSSHNS